MFIHKIQVIKKISSLKHHKSQQTYPFHVKNNCVSSFISSHPYKLPRSLLNVHVGRCCCILLSSTQIKTEKVLCDMFLLIGILLLVFICLNVYKKKHTDTFWWGKGKPTWQHNVAQYTSNIETHCYYKYGDLSCMYVIMFQTNFVMFSQ